MKEKWSVVGVKLVPVLSRKYLFEADIGLFVNDCAKTSMVPPCFISYISRKYDSL